MPIQLAILLPTFNGEEFLAQQLDSLLQQTFQDFIVIVRDDGSSDASEKILQDYQIANPDKFHFLAFAPAKLGASGSFSFLMEYVINNAANLGLEQAYMMFCDQDDVWSSNKIQQQFDMMKQLESRYGQQTPVLVHSDLRVVSAGGDLIAESFVRYQGLNEGRNSFGQLLISNLVTGCTALINQALAERALPVSDESIMHDWWLGLVAAAFGRIEFLPQQLVLYRQHKSNTIGAKQHRQQKLKLSDIADKLLSNQAVPILSAVAKQAQAFLTRYEAQLSGKQRILLQMAGRLSSSSGMVQRINFRLLRLLP